MRCRSPRNAFFRVGDGLILLAIGAETDSAVEKHFQVWPHFVNRPDTLCLHHFFQHRQKPRGDAGYVCHVFSTACLDESRQFEAPILHQRGSLVGHAQEVYSRIDAADQIGRQVAHDNVAGERQCVGVAASEDKRFPVENTAVRIQCQIMSHTVESAAIMALGKRFVRYRDVFAFSVRSTRRLREMADNATPQHILFARHHPHDVGANVLIANQRDCLAKIVVAGNAFKMMLPSIFRLACRFQQLAQLGALDFVARRSKSRGCFCPAQKKRAQNRCKTCHYAYKYFYGKDTRKNSNSCNKLA